MKKFAFALFTSLLLAGSAHAACVSNYHATGAAYIQSYNPDGSANMVVMESDYDRTSAGGIARYNTSGQVLQITTVPWMYFVLPKGAHQYVVLKDVCTDGGFAGHWDRGFNW